MYILWVVGRYLDSVCVLCLWEINPSLVISLSDIARNESAVLFIALHRAAITSVPNALACDIPLGCLPVLVAYLQSDPIRQNE